MRKILTLILTLLILTCPGQNQDKPWTFVSMPDFLNVDCDYPQEGWEDALTYILKSVKKEDPDFLTVAGDIVMGEWDGTDWNDEDSISKYADRYYSAWKNRMDAHGLKYYVTLGDHEIGDNAWPTKKKLDAVKVYKKAFADYLKMPDNGPDHMKGTAFWWRHKDVLFVSVDVFEEGKSRQGLIRTGVTGEQTAWLRKVLEDNADAKHKIVLGHAPVLGPVRQWSTSSLMVVDGRDSELWQTMKEFDVDAYLCGEVHAITCTERDGIMQIAHGGLIGYNTRTNYMVCKVYDDKIEMELKEIEMLPSGEQLWQPGNNRPLEKVAIAGKEKRKGFRTVGKATLDKSSSKQFIHRDGYFATRYERGNTIAVPVFNPYNSKNPTELPPLGEEYPDENLLSNGLIEVRINPDMGTFSIFDIQNDRFIINQAKSGFISKPYVDLNELSRIQIETDQPESRYSSAEAENRISNSVQQSTAFGKGESISMISRWENIGKLEVRFALYPDSSFVDIGFSFKNFSANPIRLTQINVLEGTFMKALDRDPMMTLDGNSGWGSTSVKTSGETKTENNVLCYFPDEEKISSLVAGGLTYQDYRKWVYVSDDSIKLSASDDVGKRIDPESTYHSEDRFYLDGITPNPFEALEKYAQTTEHVRDIDINYYTFPSTCMWFLSVTHFGADATSENSTVGAVKEMENIRNSGFLKYSPVAVRLVPDNYEQNNQQGWWDDEHWQSIGRKFRCVVDYHYKKPYETTAKWARKIQELGGIPLTYFQPGIRSEDYAEAYPGHMLYNRSRKFVRDNKKVVSDPHVLMGIQGIPDLLDPNEWIDGYGKLYAEPYDYTDPDYLAHWREVNHNLNNGGVRGVFYDYPTRAFAKRGGLHDRYATALQAYRNVFRIPHEILGSNAYLQERLGIGSDATLEFVNSVRTEGDTNVITTRIMNKTANRWYKNRLLTNYDMDGKALVEAGHGENRYPITSTQRKSILTLSYAVSGRLLLTESFSKFGPEVLHDLSRVFPFHSTSLSPRPLHAFAGGMPVLDFPISEDWHQLILFNDKETDQEFNVPISGNTAFGALGLEVDKSYYLYDFWNDEFIGKVNGTESIEQLVYPGEARMISVHSVEGNPQWISTDRHLLQGYVDLVEKPQWDKSGKIISGTSSVIGNEQYKLAIALNGFKPERVIAEGADVKIKVRKNDPNLADLFINSKKNQDLSWKIFFFK